MVDSYNTVKIQIEERLGKTIDNLSIQELIIESFSLGLERSQDNSSAFKLNLNQAERQRIENSLKVDPRVHFPIMAEYPIFLTRDSSQRIAMKRLDRVFKKDEAGYYFELILNQYIPDDVIDESNQWSEQKSIDVSAEPKTARKPGYIYIYESGGYYKIGLTTRSPEKRAKEISRNTPFKLNLVHCFDSDDAMQAEKILHSEYGEKRLDGEWFDLEESDLEALREIKCFRVNEFVK